ncbi:NAD-P-binding protein [Polyporus arcularius HHB13444]|uniref:NAD-P-binding protein n=1 Tax=Polyporus arcularius HHB13444 TaxID=1314778 RepID=A0A5C3PGE6_9APHY|nr:NAD-P-binding protein [Polyporus arcularius HHB13444]
MSGQQVVVITGCSEGGIGFALCQEFASKGCKVYATARKLEAMAALTHPNIERLRMDVTDGTSVKAGIEQIVEKEGRIDMLVNNAGVTCTGPVIDLDDARIQQTFDTNVFGTIRTSRAVIPHMAARKSGTIVNIGSFVGELTMPFAGVYSASKAALHAITDALYMECLPFNISVVLVSSGGARSDILKRESQNAAPILTTLYTDYVDVIRAKMDPKLTAAATPLDEYARDLVRKVLRKDPPRYFSIGFGSMLIWVVRQFPRGWIYRLLWSQTVEKERVKLAKAK